MYFLRKIVLVSLVFCCVISGFSAVVFLGQIEIGCEAVSLAINPETNRIMEKSV